MRLLIVTQAVDLDDPVLGFFHRWLEEFSKHCESIHVVCLKEGRHALPKNVIVHSLGKEKGRSRIKYIFNFYRYIWKLRREYDSVFVHMNSEYVVLGGALWRLWGKKISLWYVHKRVSMRLRIAALFAHEIFSATAGSFRIKTQKLHVLGHGIDTNAFAPGRDRTPNSILFLGRIDPVKRVDLFARSLAALDGRGTAFVADLVGSPTEPDSKYDHDIRNLIAPFVLEGKASLRGGVSNAEATALYRSHVLYCNLTPSGSFDKTILEAMASGCVCVVTNEAFRGALEDTCIVQSNDAGAVADALARVLSLPEAAREEAGKNNRAYVEKEHSLSRLVTKILSFIS